jgi:uncharacterized protein DUF3500
MAIELGHLRLRQRAPTPARALPDPMTDFFRGRLAEAEALLAPPFKGGTVDGTVRPGLFAIEPSGVSTEPLQRAAEAVLAGLSPAQREELSFLIDSEVWRRWSNIHPFLMRHGVSLDLMTAEQRDRALALLEISLSPSGYVTARDTMRLNHHIGELTGKWDEYGEWLYWLSIMGTPSADQPWGWQFDGHHLIVNCFVLGDQVVFTPLFMGSEPVLAESGQYAGTRVFEVEEREGLAFMHTLTAEQRGKATVSATLPVELFTAAFRDNFELRYEGICAEDLSLTQRERLLDLIGIYLGRQEAGHAQVKLAEVRRHLAETYFAWMGGCEEDSVYYYRIHSPVLLVEFDHQRGIALANDEPTRNHIHTVVRTPNGNDYGRDLLRQHHAQHAHGVAH